MSDTNLLFYEILPYFIQFKHPGFFLETIELELSFKEVHVNTDVNSNIVEEGWHRFKNLNYMFFPSAIGIWF